MSATDNSARERWLVDEAVLGEVDQDVTIEYQTLELTVRASPPSGLGWGNGPWSSSVWSGEVGSRFWRRFERGGDVDVDVGFAGDFDVIVTGPDPDEVIVELDPPDRLRPPLDVAEYVVTDVETERVAPDEVIVEAELTRREPRRDVYGPDVVEGEPDETTHTGWSELSWSEGPWSGYGSYAWRFDLENGEIWANDEDVGRPARSADSAGESIELDIAITDGDAAAIADSLGYPDGVVEHSVPDGADVLVDESPDGRQTIYVEPPVDVDGVDDIEEGEYVVREWSIETLGGELSLRPWIASVELTKAE